jgi:hypothetical protein
MVAASERSAGLFRTGGSTYIGEMHMARYFAVGVEQASDGEFVARRQKPGRTPISRTLTYQRWGTFPHFAGSSHGRSSPMDTRRRSTALIVQAVARPAAPPSIDQIRLPGLALGEGACGLFKHRTDRASRRPGRRN